MTKAGKGMRLLCRQQHLEAKQRLGKSDRELACGLDADDATIMAMIAMVADAGTMMKNSDDDDIDGDSYSDRYGWVWATAKEDNGDRDDIDGDNNVHAEGDKSGGVQELK